MKYTITINQVGIVKAGLHKKTDLVDWAIIDYLKDWFFMEKKKTILNHEDGKQYTWINYKFLLNSMPLLGIKKKDGLSYRIKKLRKLGLIKTISLKDNTTFFILTEFCISTCFLHTNNGVLKQRGQGVEIEGTGGVETEGTAINNISSQLEYQNNNNISETSEETSDQFTRPSNDFENFSKNIVNEWNNIAAKNPVLAGVMILSKERLRHLKQRYANSGFRKNIITAIRTIPKYKFLLGENERKWVVSFDWLIKNDTNFVKIIEGRYKEIETESERQRKAKELLNKIRRGRV